MGTTFIPTDTAYNIVREHGSPRTSPSYALEIQKGCNQSAIPCAELKSGQKTIAKGYVLESSLSHIAIFDVDLQLARVLPLDKLKLIWTNHHKH